MSESCAWTLAEDAVLRDSYSTGGIEVASRALPQRTRAGIFHRARRLGVTRRRRWTSADDRLLRTLWDGGSTMVEITRALNRSRATTYWRAQMLGLLGLPVGWEYLTDAARRTGYGTGQLRRILAAGGIQPRPALSRGLPPRGKRKVVRRFVIVWPADVDLAIAQWLDTEPLESAARRAGVTTEILRRRLSDVGVTKPTRRNKKLHWRVRTVDVDRALEQGRAA